MFQEIPQVTVDLTLPESERWLPVIRGRRRAAKSLLKEALDSTGMRPTALATASRTLWTAYSTLGGRWRGEVKCWAEACGVPTSTVGFANCSYELTHAAEWGYSKYQHGLREVRRRLGPILGCTAGIRDTKSGPVHVRSLDWPLAGLGRHSLVARFQNGDREFLAVTMLGMVGVLTGMLPGAYSVSINYAPPSQLPRPHRWGAAFLLREVLETCDTYRDAVALLRDTPLSTPVFFVVCGTKPGQGVVIERLSNEARLRRMKDGFIVQANHHLSRRFRPSNAPIAEEDADGGCILYGSQARRDALDRALRRVPRTASLDRAADALDVDEVLNEETHQQVAFRPATGEWKAWMG